MFLHIGENNLIKEKEIVGIFDVKILKKSSNNKEVFDKINEVAKENKSFIITQNKEKENICFSNISTSTILKRLNTNKFI